MPYLRTRLEFAARTRRDGQFQGSLPSTADLYDDMNEALAWWWSVLSRNERDGMGSLTSTVTATASQSYIAMPATQRHVREVYRDGYDYAATELTRRAYGNPSQEPALPGAWWPEYRAADGQVLELRPTPTSAETITIVGTSAPPSWGDDDDTVDLIDEIHERAVVDVTRARIQFRDDEAKRQAVEQAAAKSVTDAKGYHVPQTATPWWMWQEG